MRGPSKIGTWWFLTLFGCACGESSPPTRPEEALLPPVAEGTGPAQPGTPTPDPGPAVEPPAAQGNKEPTPPAPTQEELAAAHCRALGLTRRAFVEAAEGTGLHALAADFTVPTTDGEIQLSRIFTGCDTYLVIQDVPRQNTGWTPSLWSRDVDALLQALPANTHLFFVSVASEPSAVEQSLRMLRDNVESALLALEASEAASLRARLHYVKIGAAALPGWLGAALRNPGWGLGIDRFQRIRYIGSYADPGRYNVIKKWFAPNLAMAANEAVYYNFEARREEALAAEQATVLPLFQGDVLKDPDWKGVRGYAEVTLPDAAGMAQFDSLELDLSLGCVGAGELGNCPAWDYLVHLYLCDAADPDACDTEIGRWITTYHREGRWVHDVSPLLPLLAAGGTRRFAFYTQQPYEVSLSLRLWNGHQDLRPAEITYLFSGGSFNQAYNDRPPVSVLIPADARRVELVSAITGHGMQTPGNCAEFCDTTHRFTVNGEPIERSFPQAGTELGCMDQVDQGTVPNQYGTWWYGRSGWCPGREVPLVRQEVTALVRLGEQNEFRYEGLFEGSAYPGSGADIRLSSWVVVSR